MRLHADPRTGLDDRTSAVLAEARAVQLAWRMVSAAHRLQVLLAPRKIQNGFNFPFFHLPFPIVSDFGLHAVGHVT